MANNRRTGSFSAEEYLGVVKGTTRFPSQDSSQDLAAWLGENLSPALIRELQMRYPADMHAVVNKLRERASNAIGELQMFQRSRPSSGGPAQIRSAQRSIAACQQAIGNLRASGVPVAEPQVPGWAKPSPPPRKGLFGRKRG